ncbi:SIT4 phosphatase-associated protein family [Dillenia turbinata]|uniref:SIT4 phosphatase-associated protein family n=1 Tax=Dillenia turbinata TaxID=194707 RepID=A0AAN8VTY3_9MAGN
MRHMVESVLDKENFTLDELLDEEEIIQECKALNSRLINFLRDRSQVEQLLHYVVEEAPEDADSKRAFKFPFVSCEIFTCEIDVILRTLVEEEELMDLLFSFLEPDRPHSTLLAGYFSKVVVCLMLRKTVPLMNYVQNYCLPIMPDELIKLSALQQSHQDVFRKLVDLIGITSIMEVLIRLVGADDHMYPNSFDIMQWLADSNLLEMIVDKMNPSNPPEVHANAAETVCAITRNAPSALASKLSSPSFVARIFSHALEDSHSKSGLVNSLSVCISLLDPKRSYSPLMHSIRSQHMYELPIPVNPETIGAMLPKLGDLLMLLNLSSDEKFLPTTYGELRPPLGRHRLKIVEFIAVLLKTSNEVAEGELVRSGTIKRVLDLFFEYPYNNMLHHHVESIILSSLESKNAVIFDHLFQECDLIGKILQTDEQPALSGELNQPTLPAAARKAPRVGNIGHITRISNRLIQLGSSNSHIQSYLQGSASWGEWQSTVLQERNAIENVYCWTCGRPTVLQDRTRDSDEEYFHDRDYDVAALANDISRAFNTSKLNENDEEDHGAMDRDDEDVYFDDESAEVVISSLRLGDDQGSLFTNSNWFAFQDDRFGNSLLSTSHSDMMEDINLNGTANGGNSSSDGEVVVGEDEELAESKDPTNGTSTLDANLCSGSSVNDNEDLFADGPLPDWVGWGESSDFASNNTEAVVPNISSSSSEESVLPNGTSTPTGSNSSDGSTGSDGTEKAVEHALKEGIVGEAGPWKRNVIPKVPDKEGSDELRSAMEELNDANYWRVDQEVAVLE